MRKVTCPKCHGKGETTCSRCGGKGVRTCHRCHGTGHACPVCSGFGIGKNPGYVKDQYGDWVYCPNCHGDYKNKKYECEICGGSGKVSCKKTETCPACDGTGEVNVASKCNLRLFRAFSMTFGFSGLQYAYVGRWFLLVLQLVSFMVFGGVVVYFDPVLSFGSRFGIDKDCLRMFQIFMGAIVLGNMVLGMFLVKCDGKGGVLNDEYKRGWFWTFLLLFGFTGAHLAYAANKKKSLIFCLAYNFVAVRILMANIKGLDDVPAALILALIIVVVPGTLLFMWRNK